jgi:hypothetical protein
MHHSTVRKRHAGGATVRIYFYLWQIRVTKNNQPKIEVIPVDKTKQQPNYIHTDNSTKMVKQFPALACILVMQ